MHALATRLYHKDVFLPAALHQDTVMRLKYSRHAENEAMSDRYGHVSLPPRLDTREADLVEAEVDARQYRVIKRVYRAKLDPSRDLVLVVQPDGFVRTVWVNLHSDQHATLNTRKFVAANPADLRRNFY